jgi:hypothetical protein
MNAHDRELLVSLVVRLQRVLEGEAVRKIPGKDSIRLVPQLESLLKSVLDITDAEIVISTETEVLTE